MLNIAHNAFSNKQTIIYAPNARTSLKSKKKGLLEAYSRHKTDMADIEKFSRAIREVLRVNKAQGFTIGGGYPRQDTSDFIRVRFPADGSAPDMRISQGAFQLNDCARACVPAFVWEPQYQQLGDWMSQPGGRGAIIFGSAGAGKTFLATVYAALAYMHCGALFTIVAARELNDFADKVKKDRFLIIDDIGVEEELNVYGTRRYVLPEIVDVAERRNSILVLTTNLTAAQLATKYGMRTIDRLRSVCKAIDFTGIVSHRGGAGRRFVIPVPPPEVGRERVKGKEAFDAYWASVPEEERDATFTTADGRIVPLHPAAAIARKAFGALK